MPRHRRALGYARVSSAEQALGTSLRDQQEAIRAFAASRGLKNVQLFVEAESAVHEKSERREQIQALLREVRDGDLVLVDKLDRWSRDPEFTHRSVRQIREGGASFFAVAENLDASTNEGDFMLGIRAVLAKEEHRRIRIRTVGTRALLADAGYYVQGLPPFGYRRALPRGTKGVEKNILVIVPEQAKIVRRAFALYEKGWSMLDIAGELGWRLSRVKYVLGTRTYLGEVRNSGKEWIRGRHEPIVDSATFARVQQLIAKRRYGGARPRKSDQVRTAGWLLRDVARCGHCGARMGAAWSGARDYYRCVKKCRASGPQANTGAYVRVDVAEKAFEPMMLAHLEELREELARPPESEPARVVDFEERRVKLAKRRQRYQDMYADEQMTLAELRAALGKLDEEVGRLDDEERATAAPSRLVDASVRRDMLREVTTLRRAWKAASALHRRELVNIFVTEVRLVAGAPPAPTWVSTEALVVA